MGEKTEAQGQALLITIQAHPCLSLALPVHLHAKLPPPVHDTSHAPMCPRHSSWHRVHLDCFFHSKCL